MEADRPVGVPAAGQAAGSAVGPPADPTDVVGRRIGAALIDDALMILVLPLAVLFGLWHLWDTVPTPSSTAAVERCDAFNRTGDRYAPDGTRLPAPVVEQDGHRSDRSFCVPINSNAYYVRFTGLMSSFLRIMLVTYLASFLNQVLVQGLTGGSLGKLVVGLRVVTEDGRKASIPREVLRWICLLAERGLIALLLICLTKGHRRVGDMAASTFVVARSSMGAPILVPGLNVPAIAYPPQPGWGYAPPGHAYPPPGYGYPQPPGYGYPPQDPRYPPPRYAAPQPWYRTGTGAPSGPGVEPHPAADGATDALDRAGGPGTPPDPPDLAP